MTENRKLGFSCKFSYGVGQLAWAAKDTCFQFFLFFYYTQLLGLSAFLAGTAALLALIADAISDPIIGQMSDSYRAGKWGRRHPFMLVAVLPFCFSLIAIFNPPAELSQLGLFIWYLVAAITVRTFLTLFSVPHMALGAELTNDYTERTSIVVYRTLLAYAGGLSIQIIAWFFLIPIAAATGNEAEGFRNVGYLAAAIGFIGMVYAIHGTRKHIPHLLKTSTRQQSQPWHYAFTHLVDLLRVKSVRILLLGGLVISVAGGLSNTLLIHVNTFFYGFSSNQIGVFMLCVLLALFPASWLALKGTHFLGKPKTLILLISAATLLGPVPVMAHLFGLTPPSGSSALLLIVCSFIVLQQSFYIGHINVVSSMLPDVADELATVSGLRQEGLLNSAVMLTQKMTFGLGTFLAGLTVELAGFQGDTRVEDVSDSMITGLAWVYGPGVALLLLLAVFVYSHYRVNKDRYLEIRAQLDGRAYEKNDV